MPSPLVSIVVLSYNRPELLEQALYSVGRQTCPDCEVLVVDNASPSSERIREMTARFPGVRLVVNASNAGFTGGMNRGIEESAGEYVYLTEDDIELDTACVARLVDYLQENPDAGLAGPVMWNRGSGTIRCAGGVFTLGTVYQMHVHGIGQVTLSELQPYRTRYLPGAAIAARTSYLRELGGFHSDFFMYGEDVELCARVLEQGRSVVVVPAARVYHHEPFAQPEPAIITFHKQKNLVALYVLHAPLKVLPGFLLRYGLIDGFRRLLRDWRVMPAWIAAWCFALRRSAKWLHQRHRRAAMTERAPKWSMRFAPFRRSLAVLAAALLLAGFVYAGIATIRLGGTILSSPAAPAASMRVDTYLAPINLGGDALRRALADAGWAGNQDMVLLVAASAMSRQDAQQVYYSVSYMLYPARVWLSRWCDPEATQLQCAGATAASPDEVASRHRARYILVAGRTNPFPTAPVRQLTGLLHLVDLP